jgi:tetratricopeptide (TPR) repeat protein
MKKLENIYQPRLKELANHYEQVSCCLDDLELSTALEDLLTKVGFTVNPQAKLKTASLVSHIAKWLNDDHLVLLNYKKKTGSSTSLLDILRAIKREDKKISLKNLIPVLCMPSPSKSQLESFRLFSTFDIQFVCSLSFDTRIETSLEEILSDLTNFSEMIKKGFTGKPKVLTKEPSPEIEDVKEYKRLLSKGESLMKEGKYEEAIESFTQAIVINKSYELLIDRGDAFYRISKYVKALNDYREANKLMHSLPEPYTKIGTCCFALVKENAISNKKELVNKWFALGMKHFNLAEKVIKQMIEENKNTPENMPDAPFAPLANALIDCDIRGLKLKEMENQLSELTLTVIEKTQSVDYLSSAVDIDVRIDHAILLTRTKNYEKAEKIFRQIIKDDPSLVGPAFNNFAVELRKNGNDGKAFGILREIIDYDIPDKSIIVENLKTAGVKYASTLRKSSKHQEALGIYKIILQNNPLEKEWVLCELAVAYMELNNKEKASSMLTEAVRINPQLMKQAKFKRYPDLDSLGKK